MLICKEIANDFSFSVSLVLVDPCSPPTFALMVIQGVLVGKYRLGKAEKWLDRNDFSF